MFCTIISCLNEASQCLAISLMKLTNGAQFLVIIFFLLFAAAQAASVFGTVIVALTNIYALL